MPRTFRGVVHGRTIELLTDAGMTDGQEVEMTLRPVVESDDRVAAMRRTFGAMANDPEFDSAMDEVMSYRHLGISGEGNLSRPKVNRQDLMS